jgi:cysteine synthase/molybdopterin converting factor small subunit
VTAVRIPPTLRAEVGGARQVEAEGDTVRELLHDLASRYPSLGAQILEDGDVAPFVNVYLGGEDVRTLDGLETAVDGSQTLILLPAMAGGAPAPSDSSVSRPAEPGSAGASHRRRQDASRPALGRATSTVLRASLSPPSPAARRGTREPRGAAENLLSLVGNTPLVELPRITPNPAVRIYAKLEGQNPSGSIKDRVAKSMIEAAEASGDLQPGRHLLEPTSGNTGIALALVAKLKGYPLTCVMPANATEERRRLLRLYGAEIVESPGDEGSNGAVRLALELAESDPRYFMPFQYGNEANPRAHYEGTGAEIAEALDRVDLLVAGLGTGGTLMGTGERLRESFPDVVVAAAEPLPGDPVMGLRSLADGYVPPILDVTKLDRKVLVSNAESVAALRALLDREGIFGGVSAGAVIHVARKLAEELDEGVVVTVLADAGWKYISADFWDANDVEGSMEKTVWW